MKGSAARPEHGVPVAEQHWLFIVGSLGVGGAEQFLLALAGHLFNRGQRITILSLSEDCPLGPTFIERGIRVISLEGRSLGNAIQLAQSVLSLRGGGKPDIIVGWMYYGCIAATLLKGFFRDAQLIWSFHHSLDRWDKESSKTKTVVRLLRRLQSLPEKIHFCSNRSAETHYRRGFASEKTVLIYNGFDVDRFRPPVSDRPLEPRLKVIGHIARFHPMKDHRNFLAAVSELSKQRSDFRSVMIGKGVDLKNPEMVSLMERYPKAGEVALLGPMSEVSPVLAELDVLVVSSAWGESFPIVVGEAMSCGVPCVATDTGDTGTLIGDSGFIVPTRDPEALAKAISTIFDEPEPQASARKRKCRKRIVDHFALTKVASLFLQLANPTSRRAN